MDEHAIAYAARRGVKVHEILFMFEALAMAMRKYGRSKLETDRAAMVLTLGYKLGLGGFEAREIARGMFPGRTS